MICFAWPGFPQYASRCIAAFVRKSQERVVVVATVPDVPVRGMEKIVGCPVVWVASDEYDNLLTRIGGIPRVLFCGGWAESAFYSLRRSVRQTGGRVFALVDNNYDNSILQVVKKWRFRVFKRRVFDGYMVPGVSGVRLLQYYGVPSTHIETGLYSADDSIFHNGVALPSRGKRILFVGRFNSRKNILRMCQAFQIANHHFGCEWELLMCGCGPLKDQIPCDSRIIVRDFVQPEELSSLYRSSRALILPSLEEHWGLVVHEAVLSGCLLLLSEGIGSADDFLTSENGRVFSAKNVSVMSRAINWVMQLRDEELVKGQMSSLAVAKKASIGKFVEGIQRLLGNEASCVH